MAKELKNCRLRCERAVYAKGIDFIMIINYNHDNRGGVMLTNLCQIIVDFFIREVLPLTLSVQFTLNTI